MINLSKRLISAIRKVAGKKKNLFLHEPTLGIEEAKNLNKWNSKSQLHIIGGANHVLGGFHPYDLDKFPTQLKEAIDVTIDFLKK